MKTVKELWKEARLNIETLRLCKLHNFSKSYENRKLGEKLTCQNCKGQMDLRQVEQYCSGYKAAGKNPNDIIEGYEK